MNRHGIPKYVISNGGKIHKSPHIRKVTTIQRFILTLLANNTLDTTLTTPKNQ